jgi:DNA-binding MarR family transcriptional regulator
MQSPPSPPTSTPRFSELELDAWRGFLRAHATLVRELDEELTERHGLPLSSYDVLVQLDESPEGRLRMSSLADAVLLSRSGLSRLVSRLEKQGLLEREECASDARGAFASITDAGRERLAEARATHRAGVRDRFLDKLGERELRQLSRAWSRLLDPR